MTSKIVMKEKKKDDVCVWGGGLEKRQEWDQEQRRRIYNKLDFCVCWLDSGTIVLSALFH